MSVDEDAAWAAYMRALEGIHDPAGPRLVNGLYAAPAVMELPAKLGTSMAQIRALFEGGETHAALPLPVDGPDTPVARLKKMQIKIRRNGARVSTMAICFESDTAMTMFQDWAST